ncbi:hypothetical protein KKB99_05915 [bacterium]|nr:hypothetical protein [bacterium]MBU1025523.1 hypothetical protein [bacterium]
MSRRMIVPLVAVILLFSTGVANAGELYAVLVQNAGAGLTHNFRKLLIEEYDYSEDNLFLFGDKEKDGPPVTAPACADPVLKKLDELADKLDKDDKLIVFFICHMQSGFCINNTLSYLQLENAVAKFDDEIDIIVIMEGCHSNGALDIVKSPDAVITTAKTGQPCYGGFLLFWINALNPEKPAYRKADIDKNGITTIGEAYEYARDDERLAMWYRELDRNVWPPADFHPTPDARFGESGESLTLGK